MSTSYVEQASGEPLISPFQRKAMNESKLLILSFQQALCRSSRRRGFLAVYGKVVPLMSTSYAGKESAAQKPGGGERRRPVFS
jgi:hypothetical protein